MKWNFVAPSNRGTKQNNSEHLVSRLENDVLTVWLKPDDRRTWVVASRMRRDHFPNLFSFCTSFVYMFSRSLRTDHVVPNADHVNTRWCTSTSSARQCIGNKISATKRARHIFHSTRVHVSPERWDWHRESWSHYKNARQMRAMEWTMVCWRQRKENTAHAAHAPCTGVNYDISFIALLHCLSIYICKSEFLGFIKLKLSNSCNYANAVRTADWLWERWITGHKISGKINAVTTAPHQIQSEDTKIQWRTLKNRVAEP